MENRVPVPTDMIYKFYALFGLVLFILSLGLTVYQIKNLNELIFSSHVEKAEIQAKENKSLRDSARIEVIEKRISYALKDQRPFELMFTFIGAFGMLISVYGFWKWHREIQPLQDEQLRLSVEKLRIEVATLKDAKNRQ